jgi:hypothetical protein
MDPTSLKRGFGHIENGGIETSGDWSLNLNYVSEPLDMGFTSDELPGTQDIETTTSDEPFKVSSFS